MPLIAHAWIVAPLLLVAGALIGATGIGGVLVVPLLTTLGGVPAPQAIAASSLAFLLPALVALGPLRQRPELARRCVPLLAGALAGAVAGALVVRWLPVQVLLAGVTALVLLAGWRGLRPSAASVHDGTPTPGTGALAALGAVVGAGSALTGTGGPVLLLPLLMLLRQPLVFAVAAAQAVQLPVAVSASTVHALAGRLDWRPALMCGLLLMAGSLLGQRAARRLPIAQLQRGVAVLLLATGGWFALLILK
ncbi:sulfite exporter TauE/SafE family protein [uncultured Pseudacidovorax sp.]|uniref:sulfite exporter TauE/SafE family protein n=1 Tax=uncultured Pseudacidovorax sp. TaxID=679313 RepID=UPI0025D80368|nr:sulfite exporter TauE/SafE family protein [uncultured Pseudacidovorax sp.]